MNRLLPLDRPRSASLTGLILASGLLAACEPIPSVEYLQADLGGPVQIDSICGDGGCESPDTLTVDVTWSAGGAFLDTDRIDIAQYRVDYEAYGPDGDDEGAAIPFFAAVIDEKVHFEQTATFDILPVGNAQREAFEDLVRYDEIWSGTGTVTFAGFDEGNLPIEFRGGTFQFEVANFNDLQNDIATASTTADGS